MSRCAAFLGLIAAALAGPAGALPPEPSGAKADVAVTMIWKSVTKSKVEDFDGVHIHTTTIDQTTTLTCPVESYGPEASSYIDRFTDPSAPARPQVGGGPDVAEIQKKFEACKKSGKSEMACAMEMAEAMGDLPSDGADSGPARFSIFYSEACDGRMVAKNSLISEHSGGGKRQILTRSEGEGPLEDPEANVVVETDLEGSRTRYLFITPVALSVPRTDPGADGRFDRLQAIPETPVIVGPMPGPAKSGSFRKDIPGGYYEINWTFQRRR